MTWIYSVLIFISFIIFVWLLLSLVQVIFELIDNVWKDATKDKTELEKDRLINTIYFVIFVMIISISFVLLIHAYIF